MSTHWLRLGVRSGNHFWPSGRWCCLQLKMWKPGSSLLPCVAKVGETVKRELHSWNFFRLFFFSHFYEVLVVLFLLRMKLSTCFLVLEEPISIYLLFKTTCHWTKTVVLTYSRLFSCLTVWPWNKSTWWSPIYEFSSSYAGLLQVSMVSWWRHS